MRVAFRDNDGKGKMIAAALVEAGHTLVLDQTADVAVVDHCFLHPDLLDRYPTVLYPHGGNVILDHDGHLPLHENVRAMLVHGPGAAEVHAAYGLGCPAIPVGWCYSPIAPPRYGAPQHVLFAPAHPSVGGYLPEHLAAANSDATDVLMNLGLDVTVRLWEENRGLTYDDIDAADLVVAENGTVAHLALARGCPLVMIGSRRVPDLGHDGPVHPASWGYYEELMEYPYDIADGNGAVTAACFKSCAVEEYRSRFIGGPFNPRKAVRAIEEAA
jgi:hypothetical protein